MVKIKYFIQQSWLLIISAFCFGLLIAIANAGWSPRIEQNKIDKLNHLTAALLPEARHFIDLGTLDIEIEVESAKGKRKKIKVYKAVSDANECVGWSFNAAGQGFQDKIELVIAVDKDFQKLAGFDVLASNETPGLGDKIKYDDDYRDQFKGAPAGELEAVRTRDAKKKRSHIVIISGATVSSEAVVKIINHYLTQVKGQMQKKGLIGNGK